MENYRTRYKIELEGLGMCRITMFNVEIAMYTTEYGRGSRTFYKKNRSK